jgi:hypothetical protein
LTSGATDDDAEECTVTGNTFVSEEEWVSIGNEGFGNSWTSLNCIGNVTVIEIGCAFIDRATFCNVGESDYFATFERGCICVERVKYAIGFMFWIKRF